MELMDMLERSRALAIQLREIKKEEMDLRVAIADILGEGKAPGTHTFEQDGFIIKLKLGLNHSLIQDELKEALEDERLSEEELELLRTKYDLRLADYKKADFNTDVLDEFVIVKPSAPTLTITLGEL